MSKKEKRLNSSPSPVFSGEQKTPIASVRGTKDAFRKQLAVSSESEEQSLNNNEKFRIISYGTI